MSFHTLESVLEDQLREMHAAETHLIRELPRVVEGASSAELKSMINEYLELCKQHAQSISNLIKGPSPTHPSHHRSVDALLRRALDISERRGNQTLLDLGITFVMREIEMLKISGYEASKLVAEVISAQESLNAVERCLLDEQQAERAWVVLGEDMIDTVGSEVMRQTAADRGVSQAGV